jgi:hypothetical protein
MDSLLCEQNFAGCQWLDGTDNRGRNRRGGGEQWDPETQAPPHGCPFPSRSATRCGFRIALSGEKSSIWEMDPHTAAERLIAGG